MRRRIIPVHYFYESLSLLDRSEETTQAGTILMLRAIDQPEDGTPIEGYTVRMMTAHRLGFFPPMRLFYSFNKETFFLLWLERFDDLA